MNIWPFFGRETARNGVIVGDGKFAFPIVGESHYQSELETICGGRSEEGAREKHAALLSPEPTNPYDKNAVCAKIQAVIVGYLSRDVAPEFLSALISSGYGEAAAEAIIVGGWRTDTDEGYFGVRLNARMPFRFISATEYFRTK
jgi:hypothetical protein